MIVIAKQSNLYAKFIECLKIWKFKSEAFFGINNLPMEKY